MVKRLVEVAIDELALTFRGNLRERQTQHVELLIAVRRTHTHTHIFKNVR